MLVIVVATLCLSGAHAPCVEKVVTDQASLAQCSGPFSQQALAGWMEENGYTARGYHLAKWGCVIGSKRTPA